MTRTIDVYTYFKSKGDLENSGYSKHEEIERKLLNIDVRDIETRLKEENAILIFDGRLITEYFYRCDEDIISPDVTFADMQRIVDKKINWARIRTMINHNGTILYSTGSKISIGTEGAKIEVESFTHDKDIINALRTSYIDNKDLRLAQTEEKRRRMYVLPANSGSNYEYIHGIEYCIDEISSPVVIPAFLEIEGLSYELFSEGIKKLKINPGELSKISVRKLIENELKKQKV